MPAQLEIILTDNGGPAPIGGPAPEGAGQYVPAVPPNSPAANVDDQSPRSRRTSAPPQESSEVASIEDGLKALARVGGFNPVLSATQMLLDGIRQIQSVREPGDVYTPPRANVLPEGAGAAEAGGEAEQAASAIPEGAGTAEATGMAATAAGLIEMAGPIGLVITGITGLAFAANKVTAALEEDARKLSEYSADLAISQAQSDLRRQLAEIDRADRNGQNLAKFNDETSKIGTDIYRGVTAIEGVLLEAIVPFLEFIEPLIKGMSDGVITAADGFQLLEKVAQWDFNGAKDEAIKVLKDLWQLGKDAVGEGENHYGLFCWWR